MCRLALPGLATLSFGFSRTFPRAMAAASFSPSPLTLPDPCPLVLHSSSSPASSFAGPRSPNNSHPAHRDQLLSFCPPPLLPAAPSTPTPPSWWTTATACSAWSASRPAHTGGSEPRKWLGFLGLEPQAHTRMCTHEMFLCCAVLHSRRHFPSPPFSCPWPVAPTCTFPGYWVALLLPSLAA